MAAVSKNVYFDVLYDIVNKYNNTVHRISKMKPTHVTFDDEGSNEKDLKFKAGDHVRISKYKNTFSNRYTPNWSKQVLVVSKIKNTLPWTYVMTDMNGESITGRFYKKELQKASEEKFRIEKVLKRKVYKIYVNWKGYDNSFNSWINKKDLE